MDIEEKARELEDIILNSEMYQRYLNARQVMLDNPELFAQVNEYRKRNFYIQNSPDVGNKIEEVRKLLEKFDYIINNKSVREYLDSELVLCRTIRKVNNILVDKIDLDIDFL